MSDPELLRHSHTLETHRKTFCDWDDNRWLPLRVKRLDDDVVDVRKRRIGLVWNRDHWGDHGDLILGFSCFFQMILCFSIFLFLSFLSFSSDYILSFLHHLVPHQPQLSCCLVSKLLNISVASLARVLVTQIFLRLLRGCSQRLDCLGYMALVPAQEHHLWLPPRPTSPGPLVYSAGLFVFSLSALCFSLRYKTLYVLHIVLPAVLSHSESIYIVLPFSVFKVCISYFSFLATSPRH
jgi:hypothetical protein